MAICWERAVPLAFHLCCFYFSAVLIVGIPFPFGVYGRLWNSIVSVPDHCLFIYFSLMKVQDLADKKVIDPELIQKDLKNPNQIIPDIIISEARISKLLKNRNPRKAAGSDNIKPVVLQELREKLAVILKILYERSLQNVSVPNDWTSANVSPLFKKR